jgi:NAD(P)-dependent dehydrogenase (short-subunit alcohol dehydrogenase family)
VRLAELGADVAVTARTVSPRADVPGTIGETAAAVRETGARTLALAADLGRGDEVAALVRDAETALGPVDILVNNAAVLDDRVYETFWEMSPESWRYQLDVNLTACWLLMKAVAPGMRDRGGGTIVNMTSGASGHPASPGVVADDAMVGAAYPASKHAVTRMSVDLAAELRPAGIAVVALHPGMTRTEHNVAHTKAHGFDMTRAHGVEVPLAVIERVLTADPMAYSGRFLFAPVEAEDGAGP